MAESKVTLPSDVDLMTNLESTFKKYLQQKPEHVDLAASGLVDDLIDDAIMSVIFDFDMERKMGTQEIILGEPDDESYEIIDAPDVDIFGLSFTKKQYECQCPNCNRTLAASRFAPHLEKCMGMGRNRASGRSTASSSSKEASTKPEPDSDEDKKTPGVANETEKKKKMKRKKDVVGEKKKQKSGKAFNSCRGSSSGTSGRGSKQDVSYDHLSLTDRKVLLTFICGVIDSETNKVCTRSPKCTHHTEDQKRMMRSAPVLNKTDSQPEPDSIEVDEEDSVKKSNR